MTDSEFPGAPGSPGSPEPVGPAARRPWWRRVGGAITAHRVLALVVLVVFVGAGVYAWRQYDRSSREVQDRRLHRPERAAPRRRDGETVYRIDPTQSKLTLRGRREAVRPGTRAAPRERRTASPATSRSTPRIRRRAASARSSSTSSSCTPTTTCATRACAPANLDSHDYPLANLTVVGLSGLPASITEGTPYHFTMASQLTVKKTPAPGDVGRRRDARRRQADRHRDGEGEDVDVRHRSDQHRRTRQHLRRRHAHDAPDRARPVEVRDPDRDRRAAGSAPRSEDSPSFANVDHAGAAGQLRVVPQRRRRSAPRTGRSTPPATRPRSPTASASVVEAGYMPPWPASTARRRAARHSKRLDQTTIDAIVKWSTAGGPLDVPADDEDQAPKGGPPVPTPRRDVVLQMPRGVRRFAERTRTTTAASSSTRTSPSRRT